MDVTLEAIAAEISKQLDGVESRLSAHVSSEVAKHLGKTEKLLAKGVENLKHQAEVHREGLKQDVSAAAEGYGANLEHIERELAALNQKFDTKFGDHDRVLDNHNTRITRLEHR